MVCSCFFLFSSGLLSRMLGDIVPAIQFIVNHDGQRPTTHPVGLGLENDAHYCVHSFIKTSISGPALQEAYHKAFPRVGGNWRTVEANMKATSLLMQQSSWPYCQLQPPCRRPNASHRADLAVTFGENVHCLPLNFRGRQLFNVPLLIFEVEGGKDVWGRAEQESKAMHELVSSLAVIPEAYLGFIYPVKISLWKAVRNPNKTCVDIQKEDIHLNGEERTLTEALNYFVDRIIAILVRQLYQNGVCAEAALPYIRTAHGALAVRHTRNLNAAPCCDECFVLDTTRSASGLRAAFPNTAVQPE